MKIENYLDSTYLKTPEQSGLTEEQTLQKVMELTDEAIKYNFFEVMIRPNYVKTIRQYLTEKQSNVKIGTVIGFHEGTASIEEKLSEAQQAISDGVDELDFVINYEKFINNEISYVKEEFVKCTQLGLENNKLVKWIIEIAALSNEQIANITAYIRDWTEENFAGKEEFIFVKSSTGFYKTEDGKPNGATTEGIKIMLENAGKLPVKAAGGVRTHQEALDMINLGIKRIGTSSALALSGKENIKTEESY